MRGGSNRRRLREVQPIERRLEVVALSRRAGRCSIDIGTRTHRITVTLMISSRVSKQSQRMGFVVKAASATGEIANSHSFRHCRHVGSTPWQIVSRGLRRSISTEVQSAGEPATPFSKWRDF